MGVSLVKKLENEPMLSSYMGNIDGSLHGFSKSEAPLWESLPSSEGFL